MQKSAYYVRMSVWSSDVCSADLDLGGTGEPGQKDIATHRPVPGAWLQGWHPIVALAPVGSVGRGTLWQRLLAVLYQRHRCLPAPLVSKPAAANAKPPNTARPVPTAGPSPPAGRPRPHGRRQV